MCITRGRGPALPTARALLWLVCFGVVSAGAARAGFITGDDPAYPNLEAAGLYGGYTASTGLFWTEGYPTSFSVTSSTQQDLMASVGSQSWFLSISAQLSPSASTPMPATGTIALYGSTSGAGGAGQLLLKGDIQQFGSIIDPSLDSATTLFDLSFHVTGGAFAADYGSSALIVLSPGFVTGWGPALDDTPFVNDFQHSFQFSGADGVADILQVPEASGGVLTCTLLAGGLIKLFLRRHGSRRLTVDGKRNQRLSRLPKWLCAAVARVGPRG